MNKITQLQMKVNSLKTRLALLGAPLGNQNAAGPHDGIPGNDSNQTQINTGVHNAFQKANETWPGERKATPEQLQKAEEYVRGKRGVDILKLADHAGISVGLADQLNLARKMYFRSSGPSAMPSRGKRIDDFLKQKWIKK